MTGNVAYDLALGVAPNFDVLLGWNFYPTPTRRFLNTNIIPASGYSMIVKFSGVTAAGDVAGCAASSGNIRFYCTPNSGSGTHVYGNGGFLSLAGTLVSGTIAVANGNCFYNGNSEGVTNAAWDDVMPVPLWIGRRNIQGGNAVSSNSWIQAVWIADYDASAYMSTLNAIMMAL